MLNIKELTEEDLEKVSDSRTDKEILFILPYGIKITDVYVGFQCQNRCPSDECKGNTTTFEATSKRTLSNGLTQVSFKCLTCGSHRSLLEKF